MSTVPSANADTLSLDDPSLVGSSSFIAGTFIPIHNRREVIVTNPANNLVVRRVTEATKSDIEAALETAKSAFRIWKDTPVSTRCAVLRKWHSLLLKHQGDLARVITVENGKPLAEATKEVAYAAEYLDWYANSARRGEGSRATEVTARKMCVMTRVAIGVCLAVTPWNFPLAMLARKVGPAVAAGCAVIGKPSEKTPLSALAFAEIGRRAGLADGVLNVLVGERGEEVVGEVLRDRAVRMVSFTGSTRVGKKIAGMGAERVVKCALELGGNAPFIVFDDCGIEEAVEGLMKCKFRAGGQNCVAANRVFVQKGVYGKFVERVEERLGDLVMGNGLEEGVTMGPLISREAVERVSRLVEGAVRDGGEVRVGGVADEEGCFYPATLVVGVEDGMEIAREEMFGPVVSILKFEKEEEVVRRANEGTEMGLAGYVFSKDLGRVMRVTRELDSGMIGVNGVDLSDAATSFGGMKESGLGREGGLDGLEAYTECKWVAICVE